ncbi:tRNA-specific adenosine deaminase 1 [Drosophila pseudoobscura]|uniref:tRNA-specific adenosine deaminase 1 n=1 Tax=Drosophila pseudoobscura pseudoobscura TaxID=46245 RepID=A0A6I8UIX1_DROPS|nr:tRNA-specific adenosine deaminase 1 [Drosophila pseudoobscura]
MCNGDTSPSIQDIANICYEKFKSLPKTGKPSGNQWTVLACVVEHNRQTRDSRVVALGCGTKCIGYTRHCPKGFILNDSHAEVLARRAFLRYLYHELEHDRIFQWAAKRGSFDLSAHVEYHFFSTQTPCGDACIVEESVARVVEKKAKRQRLDENSEIVYTGGKLIGGQMSEDMTDDMQQTPGALRTKPGRGVRTLSMSCSDKLARWNVLGVQGALIDSLLSKPIYFSTLNFCCTEARQESVERAIYKRWQGQGRDSKHARFQPHQPQIRIDGSLSFEYAQRGDWQPSPNGLVWSQVPNDLRPYEISVNGKRQGVTKKKLGSAQAALAVSKFKLFLKFLNMLHSHAELREKFQKNLFDLEQISYATCKDLCEDYQQAWCQLKREYFLQWTCKPNELLNFNSKTE